MVCELGWRRYTGGECGELVEASGGFSLSNAKLLYIVVYFRFLLAHSLAYIIRSKDICFNCSFPI